MEISKGTKLTLAKESNGITEYLVASVSFVGSVDQIILQTFEKNRPKGLNVTFP